MAGVRVETDAPVTTIWLNWPERRNAVDAPMAAELHKAFQAFEADPAQKVAILAGAGGTFCAGADLTAFDDPARRNEVSPDGGGGPGPMGPTRMVLRKPLIAAISRPRGSRRTRTRNLLADLRVVESDAVLGRVLPPMGRAADRRRHRPPAAHRRLGPRPGPDPP